LGQVTIEPLGKQHDRSSFDCGNEELNQYLRQLARQHSDKGFAKTWVAVEVGNSRILGYIALAMGHVTFEGADPEVFARLPKHPMPVLHVARIATEKDFQGRGIASILLGHAADVAIAAAESIGVHALELIAIDRQAYEFYLRRGFLPLKGDTMHLYVPLKTLIAARNPG
jgi:GNAT superfamily N-acetyltransferase